MALGSLHCLVLALVAAPSVGVSSQSMRSSVQPTLRAARLRASVSGVATVAATTEPVMLGDVKAAAERLGCTLQVQATGPVYRLELLWCGPGDAQSSILGYSNGFTQPTGVAHLESIQIRRFSGYWQRSRLNPEADRYAKVPKFDKYGLGLLLSVGVACWILEECPFSSQRAELLAIMDSPKQHATLVRYYRRLGFSTLREVGDGFGSFGDQILWGGVGTLMSIDVDTFRRRWSTAIRGLGAANAPSP
mmetsp:Transcript_36721/g.118000  ORF Transcript_36721/g.118000 Transcript_36721/m.118000 type:complete len:248 (+) Transcript_36721:42-785(+)